MNETIQQKVTPSCVSAPAPRKVYVIGHKNPDTDSICSAIAYADIKRRTEEGIFEAKRAGQISQEKAQSDQNHIGNDRNEQSFFFSSHMGLLH